MIGSLSEAHLCGNMKEDEECGYDRNAQGWSSNLCYVSKFMMEHQQKNHIVMIIEGAWLAKS